MIRTDKISQIKRPWNVIKTNQGLKNEILEMSFLYGGKTAIIKTGI